MQYLDFVERLRHCQCLQPMELGNYRDGYGADFAREFVSASYSDLTPAPKVQHSTPCFEVRYASGSDYSGGTIERANYNVLVDEYGDLPGVVQLWGGHGTFSVAIVASRELWRHDRAEELLEALEGLDNYPLLDEDELCEVEAEAEAEAWSDWIASDFARALPTQHGDDIEDDDLKALYRAACDAGNVYVEFETGGAAYIDVDKVAKHVDRKALAVALRKARQTA